MLTFFEDTALAVPVFFEANEEPFVPDGGSLYWRLLNQEGTELAAWTAFTTTNTRTVIGVSSSYGAISGDALSERRVLQVKGKRGGIDFLQTIPYRLMVYTGRSCVPSDVRTFLGVGAGELPDNDINLDEALLDLADVTGSAALLAALATDSRAGRTANRAIVALCVERLLPSLQQRFSKKESDGRSVMERFDLDFEAIGLAARKVYQEALTTISGATPTERTLISFTERPDPISGV